MTKDDEKKAELIADAALNVFKRLGAKAAIISVDLGDDHAAPDHTKVLLVFGGLTDNRIGNLTAQTAAKIVNEIGAGLGVVSAPNSTSDAEDFQQEALRQMRHQAQSGELEHLVPYTATTKLVKPL
jgi:hypothetical protein